MAPCYKKFPFALRLKNPGRTEVLLTAADIRDWLPGDNLCDNAVFLPLGMPEGDLVNPLEILFRNVYISLHFTEGGPQVFFFKVGAGLFVSHTCSPFCCIQLLRAHTFYDEY